jgi:addiction module RelE/StbE family toxin
VIVDWQDEAVEDRAKAVAYLTEFNPHAALRLLQALIAASKTLAEFPYRGRIGDVKGTRELVAVSPYVMIYEIDEAAQRVSIMRLWHSAQDR